MGTRHDTVVTRTNGAGPLLRRWRESRHLSQLGLALEAEVSARHISFIETGRATPSREMILMLSSVLEVPLRERNVLLQAAGYAPIYRETSLDDPQMARARQALELILKEHEPRSAFVTDSYWNILMANRAFIQFPSVTLGKETVPLPPFVVLRPPRLNVLHLIFDPDGLRKLIVNWEQIAKSLLNQAHRSAARTRDETMQKLLAAILAYPGVPARWREPDLEEPQALLLPLELQLGDRRMRYFSTITTLGSAQDLTLQELHIEALYPADPEL